MGVHTQGTRERCMRKVYMGVSLQLISLCGGVSLQLISLCGGVSLQLSRLHRGVSLQLIRLVNANDLIGYGGDP